jgi:hypothetical protein
VAHGSRAVISVWTPLLTPPSLVLAGHTTSAWTLQQPPQPPPPRRRDVVSPKVCFGLPRCAGHPPTWGSACSQFDRCANNALIQWIVGCNSNISLPCVGLKQARYFNPCSTIAAACCPLPLAPASSSGRVGGRVAHAAVWVWCACHSHARNAREWPCVVDHVCVCCLCLVCVFVRSPSLPRSSASPLHPPYGTCDYPWLLRCRLLCVCAWTLWCGPQRVWYGPPLNFVSVLDMLPLQQQGEPQRGPALAHLILTLAHLHGAECDRRAAQFAVPRCVSAGARSLAVVDAGMLCLAPCVEL